MRGRIDQHARFRELIAARLDKPLTRVELRSLTSHLKTCATCQAVDAEYRAQRNMVRGLTPPLPPRDLWARTSASLDREVGRAYRAQKWRRRILRGRRSAQPSSALMTAVAAVGVSAALVLIQLAPPIGPVASLAARPTPLSISPLHVALLGQGPSDMAVYSTDVSQVCPVSGPQDCVQTDKFVRTPISLPSAMRAGNVVLSPTGNQLAVVGHLVGEDVIAVVTMPSGAGGGPKSSNHPPRRSSAPADQVDSASGGPGATESQDPGNQDPQATPAAQAVLTTDPDAPGAPPASAVPGLAVLSILDNVQSAGAAPDWSPNGEMLAFSAMPDDGSTGPDVYIWSPGDDKAQAVTTDHASFFASWSGNRLVVSRINEGSQRPHTIVIDPDSLEQRAVSGPQMWLPTVNEQRTQAIGWFGQLDTTGPLPAPRTGALYLMDWASVDPFGSATPAPAASDTPDQPTPDATDASATPAPSLEPHRTDAHSPASNATTEPDSTDGPTDGTTPKAPGAAPNSISDPQTPQQGDSGNNTTGVPASLSPLEPDRDPRAAPVIDWQARWSTDGKVLGVWIADSVGSSWGRLAVIATDSETRLVSGDNQLLSMTLARRGFTLGTNRVAWVGPADDNVDGELRIRTWGSDGVGGLRLKTPDQEEVVPAS